MATGYSSRSAGAGWETKTLYNSPDGINWVPITNGIVNNYFDVTYGGGYYVAVGDDASWTAYTATNENILI